MSRSTLLSQVIPVGVMYDWPFGGKYVVGREFAYALSGYGRMPINSVNKRINGKYPPGGDWVAWQRSYSQAFPKPETTWRPHFARAYYGSFHYQDDSSLYIPEASVIYSDAALAEWTTKLEGFGAEGWNSARPAQPDFSLATSMLELKDVPGMLKQSIYLCIQRILVHRPDLYYSFRKLAFYKKSTKTRLSHTAEWYLAIQFGWLPIISDCINFMEATAKSDASLKQLLRDEGRPIKRRRTLNIEDRFDLPPGDQFDIIPNPPHGCFPVLVTQCYRDSEVPRRMRLKKHQKAEFVAQFRYYLPEGPRDFPWTQKIRRRLKGLRVTPSVAWNLMPWTFLSDYFITLGKAVENLGPGVEDQLITDYCYITFREDITFEVNHRVETWGETTFIQHDCTTIAASRLRMRLRADPFAFRFRGGGPTLKQTAIIAALAASR